ncbi:hypothetical protein CPB84DRAFT_1795077 [Gymnopilus junonius]|uniref:Uncharacterized protein n=1 Tax=Gymnopilus junonius TaxID=109634 RepID=A0A9P5NC29_GYMJU|nr:hypothetical protein CPB84DRAFT_1795077 [Gymnopilus junonius]
MDESETLKILPPELLQTIFDIIYRETGSCATLEALSCANSYLCSIAQPYLLRNIVLRSHETHFTKTLYKSDRNLTLYNPASHFLQTLHASPHIALYIQVLTLPPAPLALNEHPPLHHWLDTDAALAQVFPLLVNLQRMSIAGDQASTSDWPKHVQKLWDKTSISTREALANVFAADRLLEVDLTGIDSVPVSLLRSLSSLKRLSIANLDMTESKPDPLSSVSTYRHCLPLDDPITPQSAPGSSSLEYLHIEEIGRSSDLSVLSRGSRAVNPGTYPGRLVRPSGR